MLPTNPRLSPTTSAAGVHIPPGTRPKSCPTPRRHTAADAVPGDTACGLFWIGVLLSHGGITGLLPHRCSRDAALGSRFSYAAQPAATTHQLRRPGPELAVVRRERQRRIGVRPVLLPPA